MEVCIKNGEEIEIRATSLAALLQAAITAAQTDQRLYLKYAKIEINKEKREEIRGKIILTI